MSKVDDASSMRHHIEAGSLSLEEGEFKFLEPNFARKLTHMFLSLRV